MDSPKKLIVGYDLCEEETQISCFSYKSMEPVLISMRDGEERYSIPTLLCLKTSTKQWLFGEEARACSEEGAGILVERLLEKATIGEDIEIMGQSVSTVSLLEIFLRRTLSLVKNYFPSEPITKMVITVKNTDPSLVSMIYEALTSLGLEKDRVVIMNHDGAYLYYALSQDKSLWMNDVGLFDFDREGLNYYQIKMNRRITPMVAEIDKLDFTKEMNYDILKLRKMGKADPAYILENLTNTVLYKQLITTLYFTGCGFDGGWAEEVIKSLCTGRRVFFGQNLYTMGACFAAKELSGDGQLEDFILLSDDMVTSYLSIKVYCDTSFKEYSILTPGENWFEVNTTLEVILDGDTNLELLKKNIMTREVERISYPLQEIPKRPNRMTRLLITLNCTDKLTALLTVNDLGFGEIFPATGQITQITIEI